LSRWVDVLWPNEEEQRKNLELGRSSGYFSILVLCQFRKSKWSGARNPV
jgi:hypothetical protein